MIIGLGCSRREPTAASKVGAAIPIRVDACSLLTAPEIEKILGTPAREITPITQENETLFVLKCFISLPEARDSVSVEIIQAGAGPKGRDPRELWKEMFHTQKEMGVRRDGTAKQPIPRESVAGIGEEAFWTGHKLGGTLHVLNGNWSLRLNVGGPNDPTATLNKLKELARVLLERFEREASVGHSR